MSIFRRSIHIASKQIYYLFVFALVLLILTAGTMIWLSETIEDRKDEVATWASKQLGYPIEIGSTNIYWLDLVPKLHVNNMQVLPQDRLSTILELEHVYLGLDLLASFQQQQPVLKNASLTGLNVGLTRLETGKLQLSGLTEKNSQTEIPKNWYQWFSLLNRFDLNAITIKYNDIKNTNLSGEYQLENASVSNKNNTWSTTAQLQLPETLGQTVIFNGDIQWSIASSEIQAWQWLLKTDKVILKPLLGQADLQGIYVNQGSADMTIKATGLGSEISSLNVDLALNQANLIALNKELQAEDVLINQLEGVFTWQQKNGGWQLSGHNVAVDINNEQWPITNFNVKQEEAGHLFAEADYLRLSDLSSITLLTSVLPESLRQQKPAGDMTSLRLEYDPVSNNIQSLAMTLADFAILPWQDLPGVTGLSASIDWHNGISIVDLDSHKLTLYAETWLDDAIFFDSISGQVRWQQDKNWQIEASDLQLWNDDFTILIDGKLNHNNGVINSDLVVKLDQLEVSHWQRYVPQSILDEDFKIWSKDAFVTGKVIEGDISLKGNLAAFPYEQQPDQGQFEMNLNVENMTLHYAPGWPNLTGVTGIVTGKNNQLDIQSKHGGIAGFNFADVTTKINHYIDGKAVLTVDGFLNGTTQKALNFLQNSPLEPRFGDIATVISAKGNSDIQLNLMVPLSDVDNTEAKGHVSFKQSQISSPDFSELILSNVNGELQFDNNGVLAKDIKATLLEQLVSIDIGPEKSETAVFINGKLDTTELNKAWGNVLPNYISGQTAYKAKLLVQEKQLGEFELDVSFKSDLAGIKIDMPAPFGKKSDQHVPLSLSIEHHVGDELAYSARYGENLNAVVVPAVKEQPWRGEIRLGKGKAVLPRAGMAIKGQLAEISIDDWLSWQEKQSVDKGSSALAYIDVISMNVGQMQAYHQNISGLAFTAERAAQDWRISLHSDQIKGNINWPHQFDSATPIIMNFDYIHLLTAKEDKQTSDSKQESHQQANLWPSINFHTQQLRVDNMKFGEINLLATKHKTSWDIDAAILKSATINASVKGQWQQLATGDQSHFKITAASDDFRGFLTDLGYQQVMEADKVDIKMDLIWPNSPVDFSRDNIVGQLSIEVGKGKMLEVKPGAAGRIFGLLSVASIPRRLALDFSDLFGEGFTFDSINGSFGIDNGIAYTDDLSLVGQSAKLDVVGTVNGVDETYDQVIKITPNVSSTLPVAGAAVGGPIGLGVGTAILIVDKLVGDLFDKEIVNLISYSYKLTGPWDEPQLRIVNPISK